MSTRPQNCGAGYCSCIECICPEQPTIRMQPRDETAARLEIERAKRLLESHGWTVTAPESVGCESIGQRD
jgi:hypothetical protein